MNKCTITLNYEATIVVTDVRKNGVELQAYLNDKKVGEPRFLMKDETLTLARDFRLYLSDDYGAIKVEEG